MTELQYGRELHNLKKQKKVFPTLCNFLLEKTNIIWKFLIENFCIEQYFVFEKIWIKKMTTVLYSTYT
jgi:hypothetical protein